MEHENLKPRALDIDIQEKHALTSEKKFYDVLQRICRDLVAVGRSRYRKNNFQTYRQRQKKGTGGV